MALSPRGARELHLTAITAVWLVFNVWLFAFFAAPSWVQWGWYAACFAAQAAAAWAYPWVGGRVAALGPLAACVVALGAIENPWFRAEMFAIFFNAAVKLSAHHEQDFNGRSHAPRSSAEVLCGAVLVTSVDRMAYVPSWRARAGILARGVRDGLGAVTFLVAVSRGLAAPPAWAAGTVARWQEVVYSAPCGLHYSDPSYVVLFGALVMVSVHVFLLGVQAGHACLLAPFGYVAEPIQNRPLTHSQSTKEFWGQRWNSVVHRMLKDGLYRPVRAATGSAVAGQCAAFAASAVLHVGFGAGFQMPAADLLGIGAFFLAQGGILIGETAAAAACLPCWMRPAPGGAGLTKWRAANVLWLYTHAFLLVGLLGAPVAKTFWLAPPDALAAAAGNATGAGV
eukprot:TRINITY_DN2313_c1_g1_i1.p1 TRINITY_DN2313_c1_g1~~TRINITY_DN2313_c1_g1_i1.p1  ORF type:complete len:396 (+),score=110.92 TRINITY_DN2313_c1_g1_i1:64-1251(+)